MGMRESNRSARDAAAWAVTAAVVVGAGVVAGSTPAAADIDREAQRCFEVKGDSGDAAIVNLTPLLASAAGNGQLVSSDVKANPPVASNVNFGPGTIDPNVAVAAIGRDGEVCFQNSEHARIDLVADHLGTLAESAYTPATPSGAPDRKVDTRTGQGGNRVPPSGQLCFAVDGSAGDAAIVNLTPLAASAAGNGQLISSDVKANPPVASNTNFGPGTIDPNVAVAAVGGDGQVCFQNSEHASVDLVADHLGTIAESAYTPATPTGAPDRKVDTRIGLGEEEEEEPRVVRPQCDTPTTTSYSTSTAHTMFGLSSRAYEVEPGIAVRGQLLDDIGSATVHFREQMECWELLAALRGGHPGFAAITDTEVIVARNVDTDDLAVAFRGTELNLADILNDASAIRVPWPVHGKGTVSNAVHSGFGAAYGAVKEQLLRVLRDEQQAGGDGTRVFFTGHSLGGALATIASIDLVDELMGFGYEKTEVVTYTFGAPRSMSKEMVNHHRSLVPVSFAVVNPNDPVPHVPSAIGTSNPYAHLRNMTVLHGIDGTRKVRRNFGDGRDYGGCAYLIPDFGDHGRSEYDRRVGATLYYGAPSVWLTSYDDPIPFGIDNLRMHWSTPIEGPCDQVGLWNRSSAPTTDSGTIRDRWVIIDTNDQHSTTVNVGDANWIGYIDMFGKVISTSRY
ncbi:MAG: lipase family protein [Ilumatobacter sp.]|uniref:lipase family protein n=1 Tax=Ilumatobacter sp. TaxID=1967498 RepID=UPI002606FAED|nr:lipase family protein [Ilumatobacter sp.]MDJ0768761.1 lipase family protein [Ilumatobacter sp.]